MAISLLTNLASLNVKRHLETSQGKFREAAERVASGRRINKAGDDAAGLSISFGLESKIRSIQQARRNSEDALSMMQVAEGGTNEVANLVVRLRELAMQSSSDNISDKERSMLELEAGQIKSEVDRLAQSTRFFDSPLLNGEGKDFTFQIGPENNEFNRLEYSASRLDLRSSTLGIDDIDLSNADSARDALESVDKALGKMTVPRAQVGAMQARLEAVSRNLGIYEETMTAANSRIRDADLAKETAEVIHAQVLQRAGISVLAQANLQPHAVLKLLDA